MIASPAPSVSPTPKFRPTTEDDAGFAMMYAISFILLLGTFSLILLSQVTQETRDTQFSRKHQQTLNSAMAGLEGGLSQIRNAVNTATGAGVLAYLPCTNGQTYGTISGSTDVAGLQTWRTNIYYLNSDPTTMTSSQVAAAALTCPLASVPSYAYLLASGEQAALKGAGAALGNRTVHATYILKTSNALGAGGPVVYGTTCWDAGATPAVGSRVTFQTCEASGTPSQSWLYRADLSVQYYGAPSLNLCLDYRAFATLAVVKYMTLETCLSDGQPGSAYNSVTGTYPVSGQLYQEFSTNDAWNNVGSNGDRSNACVNSYTSATLTTGSGAVGDQLVMTYACGGAAYALASSGVGAGGASGINSGLPGPTQQLVSFAHFSRCLDVSGSLPSRGLISYPCHQAPDQTKIEGNQQFQYAGTTSTAGTLTTVRSGYYSLVCFESTGTSTVTMTSCVAGSTGQQWTMTGYVVGSYTDSYTIRDYRGYCLTANTPSGSVGAISLAACTGATNQKWNAPPGGTQSALESVGEE